MSAPPDLAAQVYEQLRVIARAKLAQQPPGHTLQATALVHEAFLKIRDHPSIVSAEPGRFYHAAAQAMRQILIDHARARGRVKRGGGIRRELQQNEAPFPRTAEPASKAADLECAARTGLPPLRRGSVTQRFCRRG